MRGGARRPDVVSTRVNFDPSTLPLLAALVEEIAAPGVDPDVVGRETGRSDIEVSNFRTQVVPAEDDL